MPSRLSRAFLFSEEVESGRRRRDCFCSTFSLSALLDFSSPSPRSSSRALPVLLSPSRPARHIAPPTLSIRAEIGSMAVAGTLPPRTTMATMVTSGCCPCGSLLSRPQRQRQQAAARSVAARAAPPRPPVVRGAGGFGSDSSGPSDDDEDEDEQRRRRRSESSSGASSPSASPKSGGGGVSGGGGGSGSGKAARRSGSSRSATMSLQARVAADVLGVVHPARRNLTFSRALDVRFFPLLRSVLTFMKERRKKRGCEQQQAAGSSRLASFPFRPLSPAPVLPSAPLFRGGTLTRDSLIHPDAD